MKKPKIMGVLNFTPDSFFDGNYYFDIDKAINHAIKMEKDGADIIDVGAASTRPWSDGISEEEEKERLLKILPHLKKHISIPLSIDTTHPSLAQMAIDNGFSLINDISGFSNPSMCEVAKQANCDICVMHMQNNPKTMQINPSYPEGIVTHLLKWLDNKINFLLKIGINEKKIIFDPGIGFGKTVKDNISILQSISQFKSFSFPVLIGLSRKTFIQKILKKQAYELLAATISANTIAILNGADYIRVHDVKEHKDIIDLIYHFQ